MSSEWERVQSNPDNFLVSDSLAEKFSVANSVESDKIESPVLEVLLDNKETYDFKIISWSKSTKEKFYQFACKSKNINNVYLIGGINYVCKVTVLGMGNKFCLDAESYEFQADDSSKNIFSIKVYYKWKYL